ncbi:MAG: hypothetical protein U0165_16075 [Polyangiaceae bacterium]
MSIRIHADWYRGIQKAAWDPEGVSVLVGQNGAGKSTLLSIPLLLGKLEGGMLLNEALETVGGLWGVLCERAAKGDSAFIGVDLDGLRTNFCCGPKNQPERGVLSQGTALVWQDGYVMRVNALEGEPESSLIAQAQHRVSLLALWQQEVEERKASASKLSLLLSEYRVYAHYTLSALRERGSPQSSEKHLLPDGSNVFSLLRNWRDSADDEERFEFVEAGLRKAFANDFKRFSFESAQTVVFAAFRDRQDVNVPARAVSDGMLTMLLHLCAIASAPARLHGGD